MFTNLEPRLPINAVCVVIRSFENARLQRCEFVSVAKIGKPRQGKARWPSDSEWVDGGEDSMEEWGTYGDDSTKGAARRKGAKGGGKGKKGKDAQSREDKIKTEMVEANAKSKAKGGGKGNNGSFGGQMQAKGIIDRNNVQCFKYKSMDISVGSAPTL